MKKLFIVMAFMCVGSPAFATDYVRYAGAENMMSWRYEGVDVENRLVYAGGTGYQLNNGTIGNGCIMYYGIAENVNDQFPWLRGRGPEGNLMFMYDAALAQRGYESGDIRLLRWYIEGVFVQRWKLSGCENIGLFRHWNNEQADSDGDGWLDSEENDAGSDPNDAWSEPDEDYNEPEEDESAIQQDADELENEEEPDWEQIKDDWIALLEGKLPEMEWSGTGVPGSFTIDIPCPGENSSIEYKTLTVDPTLADNALASVFETARSGWLLVCQAMILFGAYRFLITVLRTY